MALEIESVHLYPKENSEKHKTHKYELVHDEENPVAIFRRGLEFNITIKFANRGFDQNKDLVRLIFDYGPSPNPIKGTRGIVVIDPTKKKHIDNKQKLWFANVLSWNSKSISLQVFSPSSIPVGLWNLQIETNIRNSNGKPNIYKHENSFYFLFNPWNYRDSVNMPDQKMLDEYVLADFGKIWIGSHQTARGREWVFGQFDACVLEATMLMFEKSGLSHSSRGDPIKVTRIISKMVNSNDDNGILEGRWDGEYEDATPPSAWTGSVPILREYLESESSICYGQCWVFAGVMATICRALGIPSRVVTNFVSAHDANATLTIDKYFNAKNEELYNNPTDKTADSIWNFHVWNDVYMTRPDLPPGYGGWQAVDATPQETSGGFFQCGPSSLEAIRNGNVGFNYDVPFMIATVNADVMKWKEDHSSELGYSKIYCDKYEIGRFILTKAPGVFDPNGDKDRQDITSEYKEKEGSETERLSLLNAVRGTTAAKEIYELPASKFEDLEFDLQELDKIKIGENFNIAVRIQNNSNKVRHVECVLFADSVYYTGVKAQQILKREGQFVIEPNSSKELNLTVTADDYLEKLVEYCNMKIHAIATVTETRQTWASEDDFQVLKPHIQITVPPEIPLKKPTTITLRFVNPLKKVLTNCKFNISGTSLIRNQVVSYQNVKPGAVVKMDVDIVPKFDGEQKLVATFTSKELLDIRGSAKFEVVNKN